MTWTTLAAAVTFWCIGAAWGAGLTRRADDWRYGHLVGQIATLRTNQRMHYAATEHEYPEWEDPEPVEQPRWWQRAWDRPARKQAPAVMGWQPAPEPITEIVPTEAERQAMSVPDTGPDTDEMPAVPGPATQPQAAIGSRVEDLGLAMALADIEDRLRAWQGKRAFERIADGGER